MIPYNPKEWGSFLFTFRRSDTARKLAPYILGIGLYALVVAVVLLQVLALPDTSPLRHATVLHTLLSFVISMLLVFRTNTAYDRWWEGRRLWGSLVNNSRNLALKINQLLPESETGARAFFREMIPNFAFALKNHLRHKRVPAEFDDTYRLGFAGLEPDGHVPNQVASALYGEVLALQRRGVIAAEHLIILNPDIQSFMDICGACERIQKTPIPYSYSSFLKKFIASYCLTLPLGYTFGMEYWVVPFTMFVFYVLASLEIIAEEIENPFGFDDNDLPLQSICQSIEKTVSAAFGYPVFTPAATV